jgi:hypothetical protein
MDRCRVPRSGYLRIRRVAFDNARSNDSEDEDKREEKAKNEIEDEDGDRDDVQNESAEIAVPRRDGHCGGGARVDAGGHGVVLLRDVDGGGAGAGRGGAGVCALVYAF